MRKLICRPFVLFLIEIDHVGDHGAGEVDCQSVFHQGGAVALQRFVGVGVADHVGSVGIQGSILTHPALGRIEVIVLAIEHTLHIVEQTDD